MSTELNDPIGQACLDYLKTEDPSLFITVEAVGFENDIIPVPYFFRTYNQMPDLEQKALDLSYGRILDVGAGIGCHSHYLLKKRFQVEAIEVSHGAIDILNQLNIKAYQKDINDFYSSIKYDTILLLMNGIGLAETIEQLPYFLSHLFDLMSPGGQILCDSTDLSYLYEDLLEDDFEDEEKGEITYRMSYKNHRTDWFKWLYINFKELNEICVTLGLKTQLVFEGKNNEFLIKITKE